MTTWSRCRLAGPRVHPWTHCGICSGGFEPSDGFGAKIPDASDVRVGVMDSGIDERHPDLRNIDVVYHHGDPSPDDIMGMAPTSAASSPIPTTISASLPRKPTGSCSTGTGAGESWSSRPWAMNTSRGIRSPVQLPTTPSWPSAPWPRTAAAGPIPTPSPSTLSHPDPVCSRPCQHLVVPPIGQRHRTGHGAGPRWRPPTSPPQSRSLAAARFTQDDGPSLVERLLGTATKLPAMRGHKRTHEYGLGLLLLVDYLT